MFMEFVRYATDAFLWIMAAGFAASAILAVVMAVVGTRKQDVPFAMLIVFIALIMLVVSALLCLLAYRLVQ